MSPAIIQTKEFVRSHKYLELQAVDTGGIATPLEKYDAIRASIITGNYLKARILLNEDPTPHDELRVFIHRFLSIQLAIYEAKQFKEAEKNLLELSSPASRFLAAELLFVTGYNYLGLDDYRKASSYFIKAGRIYSDEGFPLHEANCIYNICICHHTLNEKRQLSEKMGVLEEKAARENSHPTLKHLFYRLQAYAAMHQEEYPRAIEYLRKLVDLYKTTGRLRELGDAYCSLAFCYLIQNQLEMFDLMFERIRTDGMNLDFSNTVALEAFKKVRFINFCKRQEVERLIEFWAQSEIHSVYLLNLIHVLMETLCRHESYSTLLSIARRSVKLCEDRHQVSSRADVEFYEITALVHLGKRHMAVTALNQFKLSAKAAGHQRRLDNAKKMEDMFGEFDLPKVEERIPLKILPEKTSVQIGEQIIKLEKKPMLFKAILELVLNPEEISLEVFFKKLYGGEFSFERHGSRVNSLLSRLKDLLGKDGIIRSTKSISLSEKYFIVPFEAGGDRLSVVMRRKAITDFIDSSPVPVSISDMESVLEFNRRTLQLDLKEMVEGGWLSYQGFRKSRRYFTKRGVHHVA